MIAAKQRHHLRFLATTSTLILGLAAAPAYAQSSDQVDQDDADIEEVIITGSRIARSSELTAPSPVQVIGGDQLRQNGRLDIGETLRDIPALQGSDRAVFLLLKLTRLSTLVARAVWASAFWICAIWAFREL